MNSLVATVCLKMKENESISTDKFMLIFGGHRFFKRFCLTQLCWKVRMKIEEAKVGCKIFCLPMATNLPFALAVQALNRNAPDWHHMFPL